MWEEARLCHEGREGRGVAKVARIGQRDEDGACSGNNSFVEGLNDCN